jgi:hypothetical protein
MLLAAFSFPWFLLRIHSWSELAIIAGILLLIVFITTGREKFRKYRTRGWPTASGTIGNISVRKVNGGVNGVDYWKLTFEYTYRVQFEHTNNYCFNCLSESMADGATAGLKDKTIPVHYKPVDEYKAALWEDEVWDLWWDTYRQANKAQKAAKSGDKSPGSI